VNVTDAFKTFQGVVNADPDSVTEARSRRDCFKDAFGKESDVVEVVASGSLARKTQKAPIHDVDVVIVFDDESHPTWGQPGDSAADALDYARGRVNHLLGVTNGIHEKLVRLARWRNHAVKCFVDGSEDESGFTVDAMPALRRENRLLIPEALSKNWVECDPESLIALVAKKQVEWDKFVATVRMLKWWAGEQDIKIKSLVMEVLALQHLPVDSSQPSAIKQFFVSAAYDIDGGGEAIDPAGICGSIQPDLDYVAFADRLKDARDAAIRAIQAQLNNDTPSAIKHWGEVFGDEFPPAPATSTNPAPALAPFVPRPVKDTPQG
jgi:hypothetical protein